MRKSRAFEIATISAVALIAGGVSVSDAGKLDRELIKNISHVIEYASDHEVKNLGVLPFEVQKGSRKASLDAAPLSTSMPTRLENALIMALEKDSFGVVRHAAGTASKAGVGDYLHKKDAFDKLFATKYQRAWDGANVRVDCFLTGRVENSAKDRSKTKVVIEAFDASSWKDGKVVMKSVVDFEVPTDRLLLADQGYNFSLPRSSLSPKSKPTQRTKLAVSLVAGRDLGDAPDSKEVNVCSPDDIAGFAFRILYDGKEQDIKSVQSTKASQQAPEYELPPAPPGTTIVMQLKRTDAAEGALGVVLKVNGMSTCNKEDADSQLCRRWVVSDRPEVVGKWQDFKGFYMGADASELLPFVTINAEAANGVLDERNARVGWIDIDVYASAGTRKVKSTPIEDEERDSPLVMTRSLPPTTGKSRTFLAYQKALFAANWQRPRAVSKFNTRTAAGIIYSDTIPVPIPPTSESDLPNPEQIGHLSIRYR